MGFRDWPKKRLFFTRRKDDYFTDEFREAIRDTLRSSTYRDGVRKVPYFRDEEAKRAAIRRIK